MSGGDDGQRGDGAHAAHVRLMLEQLPAVLWSCDLELRFTSSLGAGLAALGLESGAVVCKTLPEYFGSDDPAHPAIAAHRRALEGERVTYEFSWSDNVYLCHVEPLRDDGGAIIGAIGVAHEITEQKRAEAEVGRSNRWLSTVLRSIGDAVIATDAEGRVRLMNQVAEELTGWSQAEAAGQPLERCFAIINEVTRQPAEDPVRKVLDTGMVVGLANHTALLSRDGTERAITDSGAPIVDEDGGLHGVVLVFRDVTDERRRDQELQRAQRLESLGVLAGGIAHDFNNMLAMILASASLASRKADGEVRQILGYIEQACEQATALTRQLLTFGRGGAPARRPTALGDLLRETCDFAARGSKVQCVYEVAADLWDADVDPGQMSQVFTNLIINADEAMPRGGEVRVSARNRVLSGKEEAALAPGRYLDIQVRDQGVGIPPSIVEHLFDPYFTTKQRGSGLGLASAYSIIDQHAGRIVVASRPGEGATFTVLLPASAAPRPAAADDLPPPTLAGQGRVLVMDDEPPLRRAMVRLLEELGYQGEAAADGDAAVEAYRRAAKEGRPFDAVILDLTVPGGAGGREALEGLRRIDPDVRAVATSGYAVDGVLSEPGLHGFSGALAKPFSLESLARVLASVLAPPRDH